MFRRYGVRENECQQSPNFISIESGTYPKIYEFRYFVDENRYDIIFCHTFGQINAAIASHPKYKNNVII